MALRLIKQGKQEKVYGAAAAKIGGTTPAEQVAAGISALASVLMETKAGPDLSGNELTSTAAAAWASVVGRRLPWGFTEEHRKEIVEQLAATTAVACRGTLRSTGDLILKSHPVHGKTRRIHHF